MVTVTPSDELRALAEALGAQATLMKPLGPLTTYGVGGPAALFVEVEGPADLDAVRAVLADRASSLRFFVIGRGARAAEGRWRRWRRWRRWARGERG
jgi:hypothetical protein